MILIENEFELGDIVYLKTDPQQMARVVIKVCLTCGGQIEYMLGCGAYYTPHMGPEISLEKSTIMEY